MANKTLVVVDYQTDFVTGSLGFDAAVKLEAGILERIKQYLQEGNRVWFTLDTHNEDYLQTQEGIKLPVPHCIQGTDGYALYGAIDELCKSLCRYTLDYDGQLVKSDDSNQIEFFTKDTFGSQYLFERVQRETKAKYAVQQEFEICGVVTNMCVISNAVIIKAADPEARIVINSNLCASNDEKLHEQALAVMKSMQMDIV